MGVVTNASGAPEKRRSLAGRHSVRIHPAGGALLFPSPTNPLERTARTSHDAESRNPDPHAVRPLGSDEPGVLSSITERENTVYA